MSTHRVAMAALLAVGLAATSHAGVLTFTDRTTFEAQGSVVHNYGFEDVATPGGFGTPGNPWTAHGVTYNTGQNVVVGPTSQFEPLSNVFAFGMWSPITANIDQGPRFGMFGVDLGYVGEFESLITFTAFTNLGSSYSFTGLSVPNAGRGLNFYGFAASGGEYFTGFVISAESGLGGGVAPVIDNVTLGAPQAAPIPEPATVLLLGAGLLGLGASRRRRQ